MKTWTVILAAGQGLRLSKACSGVAKQFLSFKNMPLFLHSARTFAQIAEISGIVFAFPANVLHCPTPDNLSLLELVRQQMREFGLSFFMVEGGDQRQDSVRIALAALPPDCDTVLIHDAARPFVDPKLIQRVVTPLKDSWQAVIPGIGLSDTIKSINADNTVLHTPARDSLRAIQTPQGFKLAALKSAHSHALAEDITATDDAMLMEYYGHPVLVVEGDATNCKITVPADLFLLQEKEVFLPTPCSGLGYDVHRYGGTRPFILGGIPIHTELRISAHSDGDCLLHALMDAILGCIGAGDIGGLFPDSDPAFENISSGILLSEVSEAAAKAGLVIHNIDITVIAQVPKIAPHRKAIAANIAKMLSLRPGQVNVKATTEEHLGFTGEKKGIKVMALVTGERNCNKV